MPIDLILMERYAMVSKYNRITSKISFDLSNQTYKTNKALLKHSNIDAISRCMIEFTEFEAAMRSLLRGGTNPDPLIDNLVLKLVELGKALLTNIGTTLFEETEPLWSEIFTLERIISPLFKDPHLGTEKERYLSSLPMLAFLRKTGMASQALVIHAALTVLPNSPQKTKCELAAKKLIDIFRDIPKGVDKDDEYGVSIQHAMGTLSLELDKIIPHYDDYPGNEVWKAMANMVMQVNRFMNKK